MIISEPYLQTHHSSSKNKENFHRASDYDDLRSIVSRNEQALMQIRRQLKQKVNKNDFLAGLSSKVSLSDVTSFSSQMHSLDSTLNKHALREEIQRQLMESLQPLKTEGNEEISAIKTSIKQLQTQIVSLEQAQKNRQADTLREMRESDQSIIQRMQKKAERSELDKIMHLSSLLAIEFELIKKRFGSFQVDYNLIWKEISALYTHQENLRSCFETERKESFENTRQKQLKILLKTNKNNDIVGKLFGDKQQGQIFQRFNVVNEEKGEVQQKIDDLENKQKDHEFTIKQFSQRLLTIEQDFQNRSHLMKQIKELKKDFNNSKQEVVYLEDKNRKLKDEINLIITDISKKGFEQMQNNISEQIRQACQEITIKMMQLFEQCPKISDISIVRREIEGFKHQLSERIQSLGENTKRRLDGICIRQEQQQDKIRLMGKDLHSRLKIEQFDQIRQSYMTSQASSTLIKKAQTQLKKEITQFQQTQKNINDVICSETILARWMWVSGQLKNGNLISWDRQAINTLPQNFIYLQSQLTFRISSSGIYRIEMGFYAKKKPSIQIIINGKTVVSAINSSSYVVHHSSGKLKDITNSEITGITYYDFFTLQENTRLAIAYNGQPGHGFFGIQRL